ncbi:ribosome-binding factor A [Candidatus Uhrbacteria bacterium RIFCSPLOWO2_12_FULL_46_10]|uniref:Ribosome-binding factor A n=1 Tax=Candidatus Uhrbacteria bacterium RIFCSPLOWO2_01_FULL_47_25 TaxID=1802402 RepID=A0A1F7UY12_9BACT|nr:MAG: Ribosome-binding factor A [Parcubacteria group bacterium GW2011_GWA2_46_9]OGL60012.1 MAG: ribosome-binding factor A [Candidatus Uhrbacteria bacterium RIFCSPHIGHO2_01_FULL_46_23]OGL69510.1 MAG: ribosome-binding factor A [Candidatus Uhrbacteria bacterium RIFCSPHIGHO2_02_FULL_47_29]OGL82638.1 MAG: ribosome-binding factor A [Candidatus Uhrbacteria bacterium RIFCSPLOWO2_01_FULL_47_25]OGL86682.1 MAG: ribosome-binding factor A [Candidatus Uhrbacteria bacterium RIFCSPLOWO2_02_FULL_46_19]OGL906
MSRRLEQMNSLLRERISQFLLFNFESPPGVLVTITRVETTPDLHEAKVYVSILPKNTRGSILESLRKMAPEIRRSLYHDLETHSVPIIVFLIDEADVRAAGVEELLDSLRDTS